MGEIDVRSIDPPNVFADQAGPFLASGTVTVTYLFSPEPSSVLLLTLGQAPVLIINVYNARPIGSWVNGQTALARRP
jgi:hypothetical protein